MTKGMMKAALGLMVLAGALAPEASRAEGDSSNIAGTGFKLCNEMQAIKDDNEAAARLVSWVQGYLSGMNTANDLQGKTQRELGSLATDDGVNAVVAKIDEACAAEPDSPLVKHIYPLYDTFPEYEP